MEYKRNEGFRYVFNKPIEATFSFVEINRVVVHHGKKGLIHIHDISPNGAKFSSLLDLRSDFDKFYIRVELNLLDETFTLSGHIRWKKRDYKGAYWYGIEFDKTNDESKEQLIEALKKYAKNSKNG